MAVEWKRVLTTDDLHSAVTVSAPISLSGQALSLVNDAAAAITEIDTGALANSDTVIPTSKAVTTAIAGVSGGVTDHGDLTGLDDDDHTQYIKHSLATAANDFLVASGSGAFAKQTLTQVKTTLILPKFMAVMPSTQSINSAEWTKLNFTEETYDIGSCFDTTNKRWVPGVIGKAFISIGCYSGALIDQKYMIMAVRKNGATWKQNVWRNSATNDGGGYINCDVDIDNVTDYFEAFFYHDTGAAITISSAHNWFCGHLLL